MEPGQTFTPDNKDNDPNYKSRGLASNPYSTPQPEQSSTPPVASGAINDPPEKEGFKLPKGPMIAGIVGGVLIIILIIVALVAGGGDSGKKQQDSAANNSALTPALQPAQSVELEQTNNALSQDLSSVDDEKDLPNNSLDDQTLGL